jgi:serine phosphatase RsbU (regulator of sigma subunit)
VTILRARGHVLGERLDATFTTLEHALEVGDALLFFSEGVPDTLDPARAPFGERRLQKLLHEASGQEPRLTRDRIVSALREHRLGAPPSRDEALVVVQVG